MTTTEERIKKIDMLKAKRDGMLLAMRAVQQELVNVETELAMEIVDAASDGVLEMANAMVGRVMCNAPESFRKAAGCSDGKSKKKARKKK